MHFLFASAFCLFVFHSFAQPPLLPGQQYLQPFWEADTIYAEVVQPIRSNGEPATARLLFKAAKILSVQDAYLKQTFQQGKDWKYRKGRLRLTKGSVIPFYTAEELFFTEKKTGVSMESSQPGHYILFSEAGVLQSRQLLVTYVKKKRDLWPGKMPAGAQQQLPGTFNKLQAGTPIRIVFYGNSIETGANSSSTLHQPPYLPTWPEMMVQALQAHYRGSISFVNRSKGGMLASWGLEQADKLVNPERPDLVVIGFGMNDGTFKVEPDTFVEQIKGIMQAVRQKNPACEFIIITTMLANPLAIQSQIQKDYQGPILALEDKGVAVADITSIHETLLQRKAYQDMTGNNVNHPNDYLARWYAQVIARLLMED